MSAPAGWPTASTDVGDGGTGYAIITSTFPFVQLLNQHCADRYAVIDGESYGLEEIRDRGTCLDAFNAWYNTHANSANHDAQRLIVEDVATSSAYADGVRYRNCLLYTSPSPRDGLLSRMPSSA